jgi:hypothetical protein
MEADPHANSPIDDPTTLVALGHVAAKPTKRNPTVISGRNLSAHNDFRLQSLISQKSKLKAAGAGPASAGATLLAAPINRLRLAFAH